MIYLNESIIILYIFVLLWGLLGLIAFIMSLICFGRSGTLIEKIIGFFLGSLGGTAGSILSCWKEYLTLPSSR